MAYRPFAIAAKSRSHDILKQSTRDAAHGFRVALAGGLAGATGTAVLYPIDTAKTLRQANPNRYSSVLAALGDLVSGVASVGGLRRVYSGVVMATVGAVPSSALYFGAYEMGKTQITRLVQKDEQFVPGMWVRLATHSTAAACGNAFSSLVFVPKEYLKQQMQAYGTGKIVSSSVAPLVPSGQRVTVGNVIKHTFRTHGIKGFYYSYKSTLMRNIPSAVLRFVIYEEFKLRWMKRQGATDEKAYQGGGLSPIFFLSGAVAGACASGLMTPMDVIKTRIATHTIPPNLSLQQTISFIASENGMKGLWAGARARMVWSGAFSAVGFGTFEAAKTLLGVKDVPMEETEVRGVNDRRLID